MKFSVIIPVYNGEKYISKSINSILNQNYENIELIIINDGSTDDTEEIILSTINKNTKRNIVYKKIENSGPSAARNCGIDISTGDYMCFLDADDYYDENLFSDLSVTLKGEDICFFGWLEILATEVISSYSERFKFLNKPVSGKQAAEMKFNHRIWLCNCNEVYSSALIKQNNIRYLEGVFSGEDSNFIYKCLLNAQTVISLNNNYFYNVRCSDSLMHSSFSTRCLTEFIACKDLYDYAVRENFDESICNMFFSLYYYSRIYVAKRIIKTLKWNQFIKFIKICKKTIPHIKKERNIIFSTREKKELILYNFKFLFFYIYKIHSLIKTV